MYIKFGWNNMDSVIQSTANPVYKHVKKLLTGHGRRKNSQYIAEGARSVTDALKNGCNVEFAVLSENADYDLSQYGVKVFRFSDKLFDDVKSTVNSQGIIAVVNYEFPAVGSMNSENLKKIIYLDRITDPGNMGTIIRSADAFGMDAVIVSKGCVDIFSPKVVRSSMASMQSIAIYSDDTDAAVLGSLSSNGFRIVGTFPRAEADSYNADFGEKTVIVIGNEANGIGESAGSYCDLKVTVPMSGNAESLNAATAATFIMYE